MKGFMTILKVFATLIVIGGLCILYLYLKKEILKPEAEVLKPLEQIVQENEEAGFEAGKHEFYKALESIALNELDEARERLSLIQNLYPDSSYGPEARRILGEMNLDEILSVDNMSNKRTHTVKPGEGYLKIATANQTTLDSIMFLNGLLDLRALHSGDELVVMPLDFKLVVNLAKKRVELFHRDHENKEHVFAKDYPILRVNTGRLPGRTMLSRISRKHGEVNGRAYQPTHASYRQADKVLGFKAGNSFLQLRSEIEGEGAAEQRGLFLSGPDMEELSMLIRVGNEVEVRPAR